MANLLTPKKQIAAIPKNLDLWSAIPKLTGCSVSRAVGKTRAHIIFLLPLLYISCYQSAKAHPEELLANINNANVSKSQSLGETEKPGMPLWQITSGIPFVGSPVHEEMTVASISIARAPDNPYNQDRDEAFIHGVLWNDDPENLLCPECSVFNLRRFEERWAIDFGKRFFAAKKRINETADAGNTIIFKSGDGLLERSHFGDLQFLHAMASHNGELAEYTQKQILAWAEFVYKVSIGDIPQKTKLRDIPIQRVNDLFSSDKQLADWTVEKLFLGAKFARRVAIGSLLHMIQDSFAQGHAARQILDDNSSGTPIFKRGKIVEFHCYTGQDEKLHRADDKWPDGLDRNAPVGSQNPIVAGANVVRMMNEKKDWIDVKAYLIENVFAIENPMAVAGPGDRYRSQAMIGKNQ